MGRDPSVLDFLPEEVVIWGMAGKAAMFKGTIAVIFIYLAVAVAILAAVLLLPSGIGAFFADDAVAFTVVLVCGQVLIASYLAWRVAIYDPTMQFVPVPHIACPDYYALTIDKSNSDVDKVMRCDASVAVYPHPTLITTSNTSVSQSVKQALADDTSSAQDITTGMYAGVTCASLYPTKLVKAEKTDYDARKAFSDACSVPWSDNEGNFAILDYQNLAL